MNQSLAREVNRRIHRLTATSADSQGYVCECGELDCECSVPLSSAEFEAIAVQPDCFVLTPGHDGLEGELVGRGREYVVVRAVHEPARR